MRRSGLPNFSTDARASRRRCIATLSDLDIIPAGVGAVDVESLGEALAALAASYDFVVVHASDWRSPPARAARDGVAVLAIVAPPARLQAALAEARQAGAEDR